jgi:excisionase family DNA binding protein
MPNSSTRDGLISSTSLSGRNEGRTESTAPFAGRLTCSIAEACVATGLGRTKVYELIAQRAIATTTVGRRRLVVVESLRAFVLGGQ